MQTTHPLLMPRLIKSRSYTFSHPNAPLRSVTRPLYLFYLLPFTYLVFVELFSWRFSYAVYIFPWIVVVIVSSYELDPVTCSSSQMCPELWMNHYGRWVRLGLLDRVISSPQGLLSVQDHTPQKNCLWIGEDFLYSRVIESLPNLKDSFFFGIAPEHHCTDIWRLFPSAVPYVSKYIFSNCWNSAGQRRLVRNSSCNNSFACFRGRSEIVCYRQRKSWFLFMIGSQLYPSVERKCRKL
jgi:hypothetical protein